MQDVKELYVLSQPIDTDIGKIHFVKVKDYPLFLKYIPYLDVEKIDILKAIAKIDRDIANEIKEVPYIDMIRELRNVFEVYDMFQEMFVFLFKEDVFHKIKTDEELEYYKKLIRKMNSISHEEKNPNPEIQYFIDLKKQLEKQRSNGGITFESIYTSVWCTTGQSPDNMTIYQMYAMFSRIGQFKNYETTTIYNSMSGKVPIEPWFKHIDLFEDKTKKTTLEEFSRNATQYIK